MFQQSLEILQNLQFPNYFCRFFIQLNLIASTRISVEDYEVGS